MTDDEFLSKAYANSNNHLVLEALGRPADEQRFAAAESHFALAIRAKENGKGTVEALDDARKNYASTLRHFAKGKIRPEELIGAVEYFAQIVRQIEKKPQTSLICPMSPGRNPILRPLGN